MNKDKDTELLPCPFCGGEPDLSFEHGRHPDWWKVTCVDCGNRTQTNTTHKHKAIAAWNTRPNTPQSSEVDVFKDVKTYAGTSPHQDVLFIEHTKMFLNCHPNDDETAWAWLCYLVKKYLSENGYLKTPAENVRCDADEKRVMGLMLQSFKEVLRISDRNHQAWNESKRLIAEYEKLG